MMMVLMIVLSMHFCAHAGEAPKFFKDWALAYVRTLKKSKIPPYAQCFLLDALRKKMPGALCSIPTGRRRENKCVVGDPGDLGAASGYIKAGMDRAAEKMFQEKAEGDLGMYTVKGFGKIKFQCKRSDNALKLTAHVMEEEQKESAKQKWSALFIFKNDKSIMPRLNVWYER